MAFKIICTHLCFRYGTWYLYAGCSFVAIIFFSFTLPETKVVIDLIYLIKTFHNLLCCFLGEIIRGHGRFVFKLILEAGQSQIMDICQTVYLFLEKLLIGLTFKYSNSIILKTCTKIPNFYIVYKVLENKETKKYAFDFHKN